MDHRLGCQVGEFSQISRVSVLDTVCNHRSNPEICLLRSMRYRKIRRLELDVILSCHISVGDDK